MEVHRYQPNPPSKPETLAAVVHAWQRAKNRAQRHGIEFTLTRDELNILWERCEGRCAVSRLKFSDELFPHALVKRPFAPSIDRIDPRLGYTLANTRITCVAANFAMNQWGSDVLCRVARGVVQREEDEAQRDTEWYRRQEAKLHDAEQASSLIVGEALIAQRRRIAGLKRAISMGPVRLSAAAVRANKTRLLA
jgi:hypothetical protein